MALMAAMMIPIFAPLERPENIGLLVLGWSFVRALYPDGRGVWFGRAAAWSVVAVYVGAKTWVTTTVAVGTSRTVLLSTSLKIAPQSSGFVS